MNEKYFTEYIHKDEPYLSGGKANLKTVEWFVIDIVTDSKLLRKEIVNRKRGGGSGKKHI